MPRHLLIFLLFLGSIQVQGKILIATVAQVKNHVITSREVSIHKQVDDVLGRRFQEYTDGNNTEEVIREWLLFLEASTFYNTKVTGTRVNKHIDLAEQRLANSKEWKKLAVTKQELTDKVRRRLEAERIYSFKKKASVLPVSQTEIETEYSQNRVKYGNESFDDVKEKIRTAKTDQNLQTRMEQWFSILEKKYKVQRFSKFNELENQ